ncbi:restriction endonuclease subunit S [Amphritea sp.]|uniref:restriction endonuclease subunit S n=1 Tax=Amphritea sp. TaxID=1872502 RepID=UPI0025C4525D|nr:restriction endonuclease subunit S [Amphritea sp.]
MSIDIITDNIDIWTSAIKTRSSTGRGSSKKLDLYGIKKMRELILELAVRGKLVPQDPNDEPASVLLERIAAEKAQLVKEKKIKKPKALAEIGEDEKPFSLPYGWAFARITDVINRMSNGFSGKQNKEGDGYPLTRIETISHSTMNYSKVGFSPKIPIEKLEYYQLQKGDILLSHINSDYHVGKTAIFNGNCEIYHGVNLLLLRCSHQFSPYYLDLIINQRRLSGYFLSVAQHAIGQSSINQSIVQSVVVAAPPLKEQQRIVAKVDELMALCDQLEEQTETSIEAHATLVETLLATLTNSANAAELQQNWTRLADHFDTLFTTEQSIDQLKQTVLQLAVMGKLVPQDPNGEPAAVLLEKIADEKAQLVKEKKIKKQKALPPIGEDEKPFALAKGWEWCRLQETVLILGDGLHGTPHYDEKGEYYFVNGNNLRDGKIVIKPETKRVNQKEYDKYRKQLNERTVLVSINGTLGSVAFYNDEPVMLGKSACYFSLWDQLDKYFYKRLIESPYFLEYAFSRATGSTIKNLGLKAMNAMPIALPPLEEQHRIVSKIDQLMTLCDQLKARLQDAQKAQLHLADALVEQAVD